ncbi:hypothetical protein EVAR_16245_1 [Eumeta japonica]|uniref:Uncharacterized protein n=1 Tax=Eumeta variegata TaxID=151549 RepID=A0A4C1U796_EUMVA|nr:hypothetical protein EVAR_16245_1 [Eumeta japonica]
MVRVSRRFTLVRRDYVRRAARLGGRAPGGRRGYCRTWFQSPGTPAWNEVTHAYAYSRTHYAAYDNGRRRVLDEAKGRPKGTICLKKLKDSFESTRRSIKSFFELR